jgi:hypothetical protein
MQDFDDGDTFSQMLENEDETGFNLGSIDRKQRLLEDYPLIEYAATYLFSHLTSSTNLPLHPPGA